MANRFEEEEMIGAPLGDRLAGAGAGARRHTDDGQPGEPGVGVKDLYSMPEVARMLHVGKDRVRALAYREVDPMPFRLLPGSESSMYVVRSELIDWLLRNGRLASQVRGEGSKG